MPKNIHKELEYAILTMPQKDKDKLLLRLIAKNNILIEQLNFQLLEDVSDLSLKREELKTLILRVSKMHHDTPGWMMMDMRDLNGRITKHVKVTKDKYGEVELTLYMLNVFFQNQLPLLETFNRRSETISEYLAKRTEFLMKKLTAMNEEYYIEFYDDVNKLLTCIHKYCTAGHARQLNIVKSWEY